MPTDTTDIRHSPPKPPVLHVLGCGDAFGSGGRLQTSFFLDGARGILIDCGPSALPALKRLGVDPDCIDLIVLTHLHGDHFAGVPFFIREAQFVRPRTRPLAIAGPAGHEQAIQAAATLMFAGGSRYSEPPITFHEYTAGTPLQLAGVSIEAYAVRHSAGANAHAVRVTSGSVVVGYSGDTEWVDVLEDVADGTDLFICECYELRPVANHLDLETLHRHRHRLRCARLLLTHMGPSVLDYEGGNMPERATDGLAIPL